MMARIRVLASAAGWTARLVLILSLFFFATSTLAFGQGLNPAILVQPDRKVEVGEEVFFSASGSTYSDPALLRKARYEWDFGDGYSFRFDPVVRTITRSGMAVTHYFMKPGDFTVTLTVSVWSHFDAAGSPIGSPVAVKAAATVVSVTGEAPMAGFEIQRAPFHNRVAQYLHVIIPPAHRAGKTSLRVKLEGAKGSRKTLLLKNNLKDEERILLDHKPLAQDDYVVIAELLDAGNGRIAGGIWRDRFSKRYPGLPKVGVDENNSFRLNGKLFFPIMAFMTDVNAIANFVARSGINMLHTEGFYPEHNPATWKDYLWKADSYGLLAIGPGRGDYELSRAQWAPSQANRWKFNHDPDRISRYVRMNKNNPAMFAWSWQDEPNMGGRAQKVYPPVMAAWGYVSNREDPHHPSFNLMYGYDWSCYYGTAPNIYDYLASAPLFGGKKWVQDAIPFDIYPIQARLHPSMNLIDMGPYAAYLDVLDRIRLNNRNLVPVLPSIMPGQRNTGEKVLLHSSEQVYLEAWMNVIHGAKGVVWFPYFDPTTIRWSAMKKFADQMTSLAPVVLGPEPARTVADDANSALRRVDIMIRETGGAVYIFAARVTEPDPIPGAKYRGAEAESIVVNFEVSGLSKNAKADVFGESRSVSVKNGCFADKFAKNAVHIYRISNRSHWETEREKR